MFLALKAMSSLIYIYCSEINCRAFNGSIARGTRIIYFKEYCKKNSTKRESGKLWLMNLFSQENSTDYCSCNTNRVCVRMSRKLHTLSWGISKHCSTYLWVCIDSNPVCAWVWTECEICIFGVSLNFKSFFFCKYISISEICIFGVFLNFKSFFL